MFSNLLTNPGASLNLAAFEKKETYKELKKKHYRAGEF